jgi:hypothetical protein
VTIAIVSVVSFIIGVVVGIIGVFIWSMAGMKVVPTDPQNWLDDGQ